MARLTLEILEGRDLPSAALSAGIGPPPPQPRTAVVAEPQSPGAVLGFTPPIGSNKGSLVADDFGRDVPTQGIIAILIGLQAPMQPTGTGAR